MEFNLMDLIGNYAFPIVACVAMFWKINQQDKAMKDETEAHKEEIKQVTEAINNNTNALTQLVVKLDAHINTIYRSALKGINEDDGK